MTFAELTVGHSESIEVVVELSHLDEFARLSGDRSPIHVDARAARAAGFSDRVAHGFLVGAYVSQLVGMKIPGASGLLLAESLRFHRPVHPGDALVITGKVRHLSESTQTVELDITVQRGDDAVVTGTVHVLVRNDR
jgi:phosphate acetyltransferase